MTARELLADIAATRIGLAPSAVHGIGVFALTDIPAGTFDLFAPPCDWPAVPVAEIDALPPHARELVRTYCLRDETHYHLPAHGFRVRDLVMYLNHSAAPNLRSVDAGDYFEATRDIRGGEELTVDYDTLGT